MVPCNADVSGQRGTWQAFRRFFRERLTVPLAEGQRPLFDACQSGRPGFSVVGNATTAAGERCLNTAGNCKSKWNDWSLAWYGAPETRRPCITKVSIVGHE